MTTNGRIDDENARFGISEATPLIAGPPDSSSSSSTTASPKTCRESVYQFLEARTPAGLVYETVTIVLILLSIASFVLASLFVTKYNPAPWADPETGICGMTCDALWFGNHRDNAIAFLGLGATSVLEIVTVLVFTIDYSLRVWTADLEDATYGGFWGRIRYLPTFYSLVDLASTVPFYVDAFLLPRTDLAASQFLRMFRLFRMMRVEGRYNTALTMFDDVFYTQRGILGTALFIGVTTWATVASLYYLVERRNHGMIYCGAAPEYCGDADEIDTSLCTIDSWGFVDCSEAGCPPSDEYPEPCYNLYRSIPSASYYSLLNLFGEFPLIDQHNTAGMIVGTLVAVVAVAVFALPAGIIGNGFEDLISKRRAQRQRQENEAAEGHGAITETGNDDHMGRHHLRPRVLGDESTMRGRLYNFLHAQISYGSDFFDDFINLLILGTALSFMLDTVSGSIVTFGMHVFFDIFEFVAVVIFTVEYALRFYSAGVDPRYSGIKGRIKFATSFVPVVDILSVLPYWIDLAVTGQFVTGYRDESMSTTFVKCLRLLRLLRFEKYTRAFTTFDDVIHQNLDVLTVTGFAALIMWIFFSAILYFTERDNPDDETASFYNTVPNAMWVTLLNLSGESPLAMYSVWGQVVTGIVGLFATGLFGIPIGVLGAGFEEIVQEEYEDTPDEVEEGNGIINGNSEAVEMSLPVDSHAEGEGSGEGESQRREGNSTATYIETEAYRFVNGIGSRQAMYFELFIYVLIILSVAVGILQTVKGWESLLYQLEWFTIAAFTVEYAIRFVGAPADPDFGKPGRSGFVARARFIVSFYSIIDLLAILPFYLAVAMPGSWVDAHDEYLRMFRLLRLLKLDKYIPSITLIDDVIRLKRKTLIVSGFAAGTLWILFAALLYLAEHNDTDNGVDPVPKYGCDDDCTMKDRFQNFFDSMVYCGVHLTGDYPIITYDSLGRVICFFMVIAAVGVVSVPSGLVASGFAQIVQSKTKIRRGERQPGRAGDDWFEYRLAELREQDPPRSMFGPVVDRWQSKVNVFLNGEPDEETGREKYTPFSTAFRVFFFTVIILNVVAVIAESIPEIDRFVGNQAGNFFDVFEAISVMIFAFEYILRLFSAPKNVEALYSTWVYATTFFGIVDFLSTAPWFVEQALFATGHLQEGSDNAKIFRIFRIFRILQLEDFITAFSKLDNVFRASKDVLKATGLMAGIIWVGCGALFFIFEENNPNWRQCDESIPLRTKHGHGCYDFASTAECNEYYPDSCDQAAFTNVPNSLYFTAVFLVGEWGLIDFTWPGRFVCLFLCVAGIALYAVPIGTLFDSFGAVLGIGGDDEEEEEEEEES